MKYVLRFVTNINNNFIRKMSTCKKRFDNISSKIVGSVVTLTFDDSTAKL